MRRRGTVRQTDRKTQMRSMKSGVGGRIINAITLKSLVGCVMTFCRLSIVVAAGVDYASIAKSCWISGCD